MNTFPFNAENAADTADREHLDVTRRAVPLRAGLTALVGLILTLGACTTSSEPEDEEGEETDPLRIELIAEGEVLFQQCEACHGAGGVGVGETPPLLHSDFLAENRMRAVRILLLGLPNAIDTATTITVNGIDYVGQSMFAIGTQSGWTDREMAAVLTYVRAVLNDSTSVDCTVDTSGDTPVSNCDIVASPETATSTITPEEVASLRDSLTTAGILIE